MGVPENLGLCVERRYFANIYYLALVCSDDTVAGRLRSRPEWRQTHTDEFVERQIRFNRWFKGRKDLTPTIGDVTLRSVADDIIESRVREWLRDHQGSAYCARCVARDLHIDVALAQAAMDDLGTRQIFSRGPCACGRMGLAYGWSTGGMRG
jgi:hypothetical protein